MSNRQLATALTCGIGVLTFIRLFLAIDLTDESNSAGVALAFFKDWRLFVSDSFIQSQTGALSIPILWVSQLFNFEGLVLHLRLATFLLAFLAFFTSYRFLLRHYPAAYAIAGASIFLSYLPFSISGWTYNNIATFGMPLGIFLWLLGGTGNAFLSGLAIGVSVIAYVPMAALAGLILIWVQFAERTRPKSHRLLFAAGLLLMGGYDLFLVATAGQDSLNRVLEFSKAFNWVGGFRKIAAIGAHFILGTLRSGLILTLFGALYAGRKYLVQPARYTPTLLLVLVIQCLFSLPQATPTMGVLIYFPLCILVLMLDGRFLPNELPFTTRLEKMLIGVGAGTALTFGYFSSNTLINAALGMLLPTQVLSLIAIRKMESRRALFLSFLAPITLCLGNYQYVYRDGPITKLNTQVKEGPYKFLFTTHDRANLLKDLDRDLKEIGDGRSTIFASYLTAANLYPQFKPLTGMMFIHDHLIYSETVRNLVLYQTLKNNEWPDIVIGGNLAKKSPQDPYIEFYVNSGKYELARENENYQIFTRR